MPEGPAGPSRESETAHIDPHMIEVVALVLAVAVGVLIVAGLVAGATLHPNVPHLPRLLPRRAAALLAAHRAPSSFLQRSTAYLSGANLTAAALLALAALALSLIPSDERHRHEGVARVRAIVAMLAALEVIGAVALFVIELAHRNTAGIGPGAAALVRTLAAPVATAVVAAGTAWWTEASAHTPLVFPTPDGSEMS